MENYKEKESPNFPLVTIITITLNRASLIHRAIESIQRQTYPYYEHIIVDGNSSDNTQEVVLSYHDPKIKYIKLDQCGPGIQCRAGFDASSGKYITMLDDDDEYLPTKLEKQVALIESLPSDYGLVYCWMTYFDNATKEQVRIHKTELEGFVGDLAPEKPLVTGTPTMMYRRSVFEEFGGTFNESIGIRMSDWELIARISQKYKVAYVGESLVNVYVNHGQPQISRQKGRDHYERLVIFHKHFLTEFKSVFDRYPERQWYHLSGLVYSLFALHRWQEAFFYYRKLLSVKCEVKTLLLPVGALLKK